MNKQLFFYKEGYKILYTKTGNLRLVQKINRSLVLNLIKDKGPISRADISKITKLTRSTVSSIVDYLIRHR